MAGDLVPLGGTSRRHSGRGIYDRRSLGEQVITRRNAGEKMHVIAEDLGLSVKTCYAYMDLCLAERVALAVDEHRKLANDRLDETQAEISRQLDQANALARMGIEENRPSWVERGIAQRAQALALQLRLEERRAKLNGLDAPVRVDVEHHVYDGVDAELAEMMRRAEQEEGTTHHA